MPAFSLFTVEDLPLFGPGDDIPGQIAEKLAAMGETLQSGDIVVIAQKIVSKVEGRMVPLAQVVPDEESERVAGVTGKDQRVVKAILDDARSIVRSFPGLLIVEQSSGWICANGGADRSNVGKEEDEGLLLLPEDSDASAERVRIGLKEQTGVAPGVIINDSHGRPWRFGTVGISIGCAGLAPLWDQRGRHDLFGHELVASEECIADELAAAASLLMGQGDEGYPVVIVRGYRLPAGVESKPATSLQRPAEIDAFR